MKPNSKVCSMCKESKALEAYSYDHRYKDKLLAACKVCYKKHRHQYYLRVKKKLLAKRKAIYKEKIKDPNYKKDILAKAKIWRDKNKAKTKIQRGERDNLKFSKLKHSSKKRNIKNTLSFKEYKDIIKDRTCYYCDFDFSKETGHNLNRIDNNKGYKKDNVKPCCSYCNYIMLDFTVEELKSRLIKIHRRL